LTISRAGFDVVVYGSSASGAILRDDLALAEGNGFEYVSVLSQSGVAARFARYWLRLRSKLARLMHKHLGVESWPQLGPSAAPLWAAAKRENAALYIVHTEAGLWVGSRLLARNCPVAADLEDWHSEDMPQDRRQGRPVRLLQTLERKVLQQCTYVTCPSQAMSQALVAAYDAPAATLVYNAFPWADRASIDGLRRDRTTANFPSIHWFSQTLGTDRGLADLLQALPYLRSPVELHLRGSPATDFADWAAKTIPTDWQHRVLFHGLVTNSELLSRIAEHDIGFAGEMKHSLNKEYTVSNKVLHYLLAGLAVVASDTEGQVEVARKAPDAVLIYRSGDPLHLAEQLNRLLSSREALEKAKASALRAAREYFCWENQEAILVEKVRAAIPINSSGQMLQHIRA